ncbi:Alpha/Beta hydrolase protein [Mycena galopus ATCC 62051]|nr:Alpha/Beta hydrolase protein [Mycena galopus ATCC 62051]
MPNTVTGLKFGTPQKQVPFNITVSDEQLDLLKHKLPLTRFPDELDDAGWAYGAPLADIRRLVSRWKDGYDWRKHEALLNAELPQFTRDTVQSELETAIPLLFVHGWPCSFIEAHKITPLLTAVKPDRPSFHVVAISLPGYGFSEAPRKIGFCLALHQLVNTLELIIHSGTAITRKIAVTYGENTVKLAPPAFSFNPFRLFTSLSMMLQLHWLSAPENADVARLPEVERTEVGYLTMQSTKPQTLGYGLTDSPVGLLAWIYEKLGRGRTTTLVLFFRFSLGADSVLYAHSVSWVRRTGNVVFESVHTMGGHFTSHEVPELLVSDLHKMFDRGGPAYGVIPGRVGY